MMGEVLAVRDNLRVSLVVDDSPENPRKDYDHICNVVTLPSRGYADRYVNVDSDGGPLADGWARLLERHEFSVAVDLFERWARIFHGAVTLYDTPTDGANAVWYITAEVALREGIADSVSLLKGERDEYRAWATGDVWGYVIERRITWVRKGGEDELETWEHVDSCFGFYGYEYAEGAAREAFEAFNG